VDLRSTVLAVTAVVTTAIIIISSSSSSSIRAMTDGRASLMHYSMITTPSLSLGRAKLAGLAEANRLLEPRHTEKKNQ